MSRLAFPLCQTLIASIPVRSCQSSWVAAAQRMPSHANRHPQCLDVMSGTKTEPRRLTQADKRVVAHKLVQVPADFDYVVSACSDSEQQLGNTLDGKGKLGANAFREQSSWFCTRRSLVIFVRTSISVISIYSETTK